MPEQTIVPEEDFFFDIDHTSEAFELDKLINLYNCNGLYVRMFNKSGQKKFMEVSKLPRDGWWVPIATKHEEFSLYDKNGAEQCVVIFPWHRYLANKNFDEKNQENLFNVEWVGNLECNITYLKKSYSTLLYILVFIMLCVVISFMLLIN